MGEAIQPGLLVWGRIENGRAVLEPAFRHHRAAEPAAPPRPVPPRRSRRRRGRDLRTRLHAASRSPTIRRARSTSPSSCRSGPSARPEWPPCISPAAACRPRSPRHLVRAGRRRGDPRRRGARGAPLGCEQVADDHGARPGHRRRPLLRSRRQRRGGRPAGRALADGLRSGAEPGPAGQGAVTMMRPCGFLVSSPPSPPAPRDRRRRARLPRRTAEPGAARRGRASGRHPRAHALLRHLPGLPGRDLALRARCASSASTT